jgi:hypothetical protein
LPTNKGITYFAENVLDNDLKTAWIEGQPGTDGAFVTFQFDRNIEFYGFEYVPGIASHLWAGRAEKDFAGPIINLLCSGPKSARFAPSVYIPSIKANIDDVLISWHNRISSKDVIKLPSNGLTDTQKSLFFPLGEPFRCFEKPGETMINSFAAFGFFDCDMSYGFVQRRIYITEKGNQFTFTRVE